jgi:N-acyl-L-homoserine lactone synthetase
MSAEVRHSTFSVPRSSQKILSDRLAALLARIECRRADSAGEREAIFRLRYQAYLREGAISANDTGRFTDADDEAENAYIFGFYVDGKLASSVRLHIATKEHPDFPSLHVFPDVLQPLLDAGRVIIDSTRFVADEKLSRLHRGLPYATLRPCMLAAEYFQADDLLAAVRVEHQAFYQRAFSHQVLSAARPYPQLAKPISLMSLDFPSAAEWLYRRYPFFRSTVLERRRLFERLTDVGIQPSQDTADTNELSQRQGNIAPFRERQTSRVMD